MTETKRKIHVALAFETVFFSYVRSDKNSRLELITPDFSFEMNKVLRSVCVDDEGDSARITFEFSDDETVKITSGLVSHLIVSSIIEAFYDVKDDDGAPRFWRKIF